MLVKIDHLLYTLLHHITILYKSLTFNSKQDNLNKLIIIKQEGTFLFSGFEMSIHHWIASADVTYES